MRTWLKLAALRDAEGNPVRALIAADEVAEEDLAKLAKTRGQILRADVAVPRNLGLHRKAFVLLAKVFPHTNYPTQDRLRAAMTVAAGFVDDVIDPYTGETAWVPKSWSFDNMDQAEFEDLYDRLIDVAVHIVSGSRREDWERAVDEIIRM